MKKVYILFVLFITVISISAQTNQLLTVSSEESGAENNRIGVSGIADPLGINGFQLFEYRPLGEFTTGDAVVDGFIEESCERYKIDPLLIYAQMNQESAFKKKAISHKGASGLMQLMPDTATRFGVKDIYDPQQNIDAGVKYMRWLLDRFEGDLSLALAGYNAGEGAVKKYGNKIPPYRETKNYVARIMAHYEQISEQTSNTEDLNILDNITQISK